MNSIIYRYLSSFVSAFLMFFVQMLIVSKLSVENYGFYNFALSFLVILSIFSNFGLDGVFKTIIPKFFKNDINYQTICNNFIYYKLIITFSVSIILYIILYLVFQEVYFSLILIILFFFTILNQFILDSIFQLTYRDNLVFYLRLVSGLCKLIIILLNTNILVENLIFYFLIIELLIFIFIITFLQPITSFDKSFKILSHLKKSYHFNLNTIFDLVLTVSTGIWILKFSNMSYIDIGYFSFLFNIVIICSDRFSPLSKLESYMTNFYLINFNKNKLIVEQTFSRWFKLGVYYSITVFSFFIIFFNEFDLYFLDSKYSFLINIIAYYLIVKLISQLCYMFTARIIYLKKFSLFSMSSFISIFSFSFTLLIIFLTHNFSYKTLIIPFCIGYLSKTAYLFLNSYSVNCFKIKVLFYFKMIAITAILFILNYLNSLFNVVSNFFTVFFIFIFIYVFLTYYLKILTKSDFKILLNTGNF